MTLFLYIKSVHLRVQFWKFSCVNFTEKVADELPPFAYGTWTIVTQYSQNRLVLLEYENMVTNFVTICHILFALEDAFKTVEFGEKICRHIPQSGLLASFW